MKKIRYIFLAAYGFLIGNSYPGICQPYCIPTFSGATIFVDNFSFHTLVNSYSGFDSSGYTFYPDTIFTTSLSIGKTYPITISKEHPAGISGKYAAWIDYNNDSLFDQTELIHYDSTQGQSTYGFVSIPNDSSYAGKKRLRVITAWYPQTVLPCGNYNQGEAEDYVVNIVLSQPDTQTYCMPFNPANMDNFEIDNFQLGSILNNNSGSNTTNYVLYPSWMFTTSLALSTSYPVYISKGITAGNTGGYALWIDLDNNGDFSSSEKLYDAGPGLTSTTGSILIPNDTSYVGIRRLRVRSEWAAIPVPYGLHSGTETEDYLVTIVNTAAAVTELKNPVNYFSVFPNPANGIVNIASDVSLEQILVTNSVGELIHNIQTKVNMINLKMNAPGVYFITMKSGDQTSTKKLIVTQ